MCVKCWAKILFYFGIVKFFGLLVMGYCFRNIMDLSIEDIYNLKPSGFVFFEYARSMSWLLMGALLFFLLDLIVIRFFGDQDTPNSARLKKISFILIVIVLCGFVAHIFYLFLSGRGQFENLWRLFLDMFMLAAGVAYMYVELCVRPKKLAPNLWLGVSGGMSASLVLVGLYALLTFAPPSEMRKIETDRHNIDLVAQASNKVMDYFHQNGSMPATLAALPQSDDYHQLQYARVSAHKATICTSLIGNWAYGKRVRGYMSDKPKVGDKEHCKTVTSGAKKPQQFDGSRDY